MFIKRTKTRKNKVSDQNSLNLTYLKETNDIELLDTKSKFDHLRQSLHLVRQNEKSLSSTNLLDIPQETSITEIKPNAINSVLDTKKQMEIFDTSLKFLAIYRCYYWSKNDNIRKGKLFFTGTEMFFKCTRMPFIKLRLHFSDITNVVKIKNFKHKFETVVNIDTSFGSSYAFYKFRIPKTVVRTNILQLIEEYKRVNELGYSEPEHTHLMKFRKLGQPISNLKGVLKQSMHRQYPDEFDEDKSTENQKSRFKSLRRIKLDRSKSSDFSAQTDSKNRSKYIKRKIGRVFSHKSYEQSTSDESDAKPEPESCSLASILDSSEDENLDFNQLSGAESDIDEDEYEEIVEEQLIEIKEEILIDDKCKTEYLNLKSSFSITLFITFISIVIFFVLALNNFKRLSLIERKILELI